ncbi:E2 [Trematomus bernacchii papillomavirus]|nr:E2 [Trematomus bernacchii papillomavirus]
MDLDILADLDKNQLAGRYKVKTLAQGYAQLLREELYVTACLTYRESQRLPHHLFQGVVNGKAIQIPSVFALISIKKGLQDFIPIVKSLLDSGVGTGKFNYHDLQPSAYKQAPVDTIKQIGYYDKRGYPTYAAFYIKERNIWTKIIPEGDEKGFYWKDKTKKIYYYTFPQQEEEEETAPTPPLKGAKKAKPPPKGAKKPKLVKVLKQKRPAEGPKSKQLLGREGHGLKRLLAEAHDPPGIEISGPYEIIKGQRRRLMQKNTFLDITSLYNWKKGKKAFVILFQSVQAREEFLTTHKTTSDISIRLCSFE